MKIEDIKIVESESFVLAVFDLLFLILPGIAMLYVFNNVLINSFDWIKLILISAAITAPLALINTFCILIFIESPKSNSKDLFVAFSLGTMFSGILLYVVIAINYFAGRSLGECIYFITFVELLVMFASFYRIKKMRKANRSQL